MTTTNLPSAPAKNPYAPPRPYIPGSRTLKILLISHTCQSRTEGQPKAQALAALSDVELHLLTPARWMHYGKWREAQTPVMADGEAAKFRFTAAPVRLPWVGPAQYFLHTYPSLPKVLREFRPDVIDLWEEPWGRVSAQACRLRNRILPSAKIVSETEQNIFKNLPWPFEKYRSFTLKNADYVVGRNSESVAHLRQKGYCGPAEVVPNAVDTGLFRPMDRAACREKLFAETSDFKSISNNGENTRRMFLAGYVGRLVPEKGLMDLLEAVPHCLYAKTNVHMLFLGEGPLEGDLRARAAALGEGVKSRVHFLPARPLEELLEIMNALDVFVLPSLTTARWKEQFGRVLIEAAACGTPCIGTNSGAIPDVIADSGLVVPEHDPRGLAEAIGALDNDRELARRMGQAGLHNARAYFTWQRVAERMAMIYQAVTATKAGISGGI